MAKHSAGTERSESRTIFACSLALAEALSATLWGSAGFCRSNPGASSAGVGHGTGGVAQSGYLSVSPSRSHLAGLCERLVLDLVRSASSTIAGHTGRSACFWPPPCHSLCAHTAGCAVVGCFAPAAAAVFAFRWSSSIKMSTLEGYCENESLQLQCFPASLSLLNHFNHPRSQALGEST